MSASFAQSAEPGCRSRLTLGMRSAEATRGCGGDHPHRRSPRRFSLDAAWSRCRLIALSPSSS